MNENTREGMGFLCRWVLLALTVATMLVVAVSCLMGAAATVETDWELVVPDTLWRESKTEYSSLYGYCSKKLGYHSPPLGVTVWDSGDYKFTDYSFVFRSKRSQPGKKHIEVRGVPYGPFAFQKRTGNLYVLPLGREVFMVDIRLAIKARQQAEAGFEDCLSAMKSRGEVALVLCEKIGNYTAAVKSAKALKYDLPVLCIDDQFGTFREMRTLQRTRTQLAYGKADYGMTFVTDDPALAELADRDRIATCFIGRFEPSSGWKPKMMRSFATCAEFKEYLATGPVDD